MKLQLLDELIALGHSDVRRTECVIAVRVKNTHPDIERARKHFPKTSSFPISIKSHATLQAFVDEPLISPLHLELSSIEEGNLLALKMSHILGDAVSMFLFLKALMGHEVSTDELSLKKFPKKKDTPFRDLLNSQLWPRKGAISSRRKIIRETFVHGEQNGPLLNDLFLYSLLESIPYSRKSVWVPVNVRQEFWKGFGNGLSRMRVYPPRGSNLPEKLAHIRNQKQQAMINGEVALPPQNFDIKNRHQRLLYEMWVRRPWADWGTVSLSHISNRQGMMDEFSEVWGVSNLMPAHNGAIFALTSGEKTDFTLTYDPAVASDEEARNLMRDFLLCLRAKLEK